MGLLGKIGIIFLLILSAYGADLKVSSTQIIAGENVNFEISAIGNDVRFPQISNIDGYPVSQTGKGIKTTDINGNVKVVKTQGYIFYPQKDVTIPAFIVKANGKEEYTQPVQIRIVSQNQMNNKAPFSVSMNIDNKNPYIGQMLKLDVLIKVHERLQIGDLQMGIDGIDDFWNKDKPQQSQIHKNGYRVIKASYWISPLKEGNLTLTANVRVGMQANSSDPFGSFFQRLNYKSFKTKPINLHVKSLPNGTKAVGDFTIEAIIDKKEVEAGKPVNVTVKIQGNGNLEDVESLKQEIKDVVIYDDKPKIKKNPINGIYQSQWTQKFALISSHDFIIEPFFLTFFDTKTNQIKTIKTNPIKIHVKGKVAKSIEAKSEIISPPKKEIIIKKEDANPLYMIAMLFTGVVLGFFIARIDYKKFLPKKVKIFKNDKELLKEMLALKGKDKKLDFWIEKLELNIYENGQNKINKKEINHLIKNLHVKTPL